MSEAPLKPAKHAPNESQENTGLSFKKKERRPGVDVYEFKNVAVAINTTGENYAKLPELLFGTFDHSLGEGNPLAQPQSKRAGVTMEYVRACIQQIAEATGHHEFWFDPYSIDKRPEARLRLFQRFGNIIPAPEGRGFILKV